MSPGWVPADAIEKPVHDEAGIEGTSSVAVCFWVKTSAMRSVPSATLSPVTESSSGVRSSDSRGSLPAAACWEPEPRLRRVGVAGAPFRSEAEIAAAPTEPVASSGSG